MTYHIVVGDGSIWEEISPMKACWVSQLVFYQVFNAVNDCAFKRKCFMMENISFKKDTEKVIVKFKAEAVLCLFLSSNKHPFEGHKISCTKTISCILIWEWKGSFQVHGLFMISKKSIMRCTFLYYVALIHAKKFNFFNPSLKIPSYELVV